MGNWQFGLCVIAGIAWIGLMIIIVKYCGNNQTSGISSDVTNDHAGQSVGHRTVSYHVSYSRSYGGGYHYSGGHCGADGGGADGCG